MTSAAIDPSTKRPQTYVLDRAATGIGFNTVFTDIIKGPKLHPQMDLGGTNAVK
jgi:hypothetical protein